MCPPSQVIRDQQERAGKRQQGDRRQTGQANIDPRQSRSFFETALDQRPQIARGNLRLRQREYLLQQLSNPIFFRAHGLIPIRTSSLLSIRTARNNRDLTVPSGTPSASAI